MTTLLRRLLYTVLTAGPALTLAAAPVAPPTFQFPAGQLQAPTEVTIRCATPDAEIHVTLDGAEPKPTDTEVDSGERIIIDRPLTLKAKAWLPDGSSSPTQTMVCALAPAQGLRASFDDQSVPTFVLAGEKTRVAVSLRNIGTVPWGADYVLAPRKPRDGVKWGVAGVSAAKVTPTWDVAAFEFMVTAPTEPGTYNFQWQLTAPDGTGFGEPSPLKRVEVVSAQEYEQLLAKFGGPDDSGSLEAPARAKQNKETADLAPLPAGITEKSEAGRIFRLLESGGRSFTDLRKAGFKGTDAELEALAAKYPAVFELTRMKRFENGKRIIPGWPALRLRPGYEAGSLPKGIARGSDVARLYAELKRSARSYRYLRTIGFNLSDSEFQLIIDRNPRVFGSTRIIRRDEKGTRIIPGWPGIRLAGK